jgi:hypothetical protein
MAAEASFTLRAVDATKQAFASVQNSLQKIQSTTQTIAKGLTGFLGFQAVVGAVTKLNSTLEDAEKNAVKLGLSSDEMDRLTIATNAADEAALGLQKTLAKATITGAGAFMGIDAAGKAASIRFQRSSEELKKLEDAYRKVKDEINSISDTPAQKFENIRIAISELETEVSQMHASRDAVKIAEKQLQIANLQKAQAEITTSVFNEMDDAIQGTNKTMSDFADSQLTEVEYQKRLNDQIAKKIKLLDAVDAQLKGKTKSLDITTVTNDDIQLMMDKIALEKELSNLLGKRKVFETDLQIIAKNSGDIIASGFEDAIFSGQKLGEVIKAIGMDLMRMVFQQTVTAPLAKGISTAILAGFRANGGPVTGGSAYVVGERGPELFIPNGSGSIVSNSNMNQGGGSAGSSININYNIAAGVTRNELAPILEQERRRLKAEIPDMVRRGGAYRSAFA